jgi:hypothetical protein
MCCWTTGGRLLAGVVNHTTKPLDQIPRDRKFGRQLICSLYWGFG